MVEGIIITIVGGLFLFFFAAYFKNRSEISDLKAANLPIADKTISTDTQPKPSDNKETANLNKQIAELSKQITDNESKSEKVISDLQAIVLKYESNDAILAKYPFDKSLGIRIDVERNVLCPVCIHENPSIEMIMRPENYYWRCEKCEKFAISSKLTVLVDETKDAAVPFLIAFTCDDCALVRFYNSHFII